MFRTTCYTLCVLTLLSLWGVPTHAEIDPEKGTFSYAGNNDIDAVLGQIALYLIKRNRREGSTYTSRDIPLGIVGYQMRYFDNGNKLIDRGDWFSVRRYQIPAEPDTLQPEGYYKSEYMEFVDVNLNGIDEKDYYFLKGRRFDLQGQPPEILHQYQMQIESGVNAYLKQVSFQTITQALGARGRTEIKKDAAYADGSLPSQMVLGLNLKFVFRPITRNGTELSQNDLITEIRQQLGFVFSATVEYTDLNGYRFRDLADQTQLLQRTYDPSEKIVLSLILESLFDPDGDGIITGENIENGYTRFRELHQQLIESARSQNRRIVFPSEKLARLREEYQTIRKESFVVPDMN